MVQGFVDTITVSNNTVLNVHSDGWAYGIEVTTSGNNPALPPTNVNIENNIVNDITATQYDGVGLSIDRTDQSDPNTAADASEVVVENNQFINTLIGVVNKDEFNQLDASPNWWGSVAGPAEGQVYGDVSFAPWCGDAECSFLVPTDGVIEIPAETPSADVQQYLDNAPEGTEIRFLGSPGAKNGGFEVNTPHLTIKLMDGTVIQNNSSCFEVNADYTTITTESIGGALCKPTGDDCCYTILNPKATAFLLSAGVITINLIIFNDSSSWFRRTININTINHICGYKIFNNARICRCATYGNPKCIVGTCCTGEYPRETAIGILIRNYPISC